MKSLEYVNFGGTYVTSIEVDLIFPAASYASTVILLVPSFFNVISEDQVVVPVAISPFTVTLVTPEPDVSEAVPDTNIVGFVNIEPSAGDAIVITGGVESKVTVRAKVAVLPELSVAITVIVFAPSLRETLATQLVLLMVTAIPLTATLDIPDESEAVPDTETIVVFTNSPLSGDVMERIGKVASTVFAV